MSSLTFKKVRNAAINRLAFYLSPIVLQWKHHYNNRNAIKIWIHDDPFLLHVPKTAGTSIAKSLGRVEPGHFRFSHLAKMDGTLASRNSYYFVSRNPADRIISTYNYINDLHRKFGTSNLPAAYYAENVNDFIIRYLKKMDVEKHYFLRSVKTIVSGAPLDRVFAIGFDDLQENLNKYLCFIGEEEINLLHENKSSLSVDRSELSDEALEIVKDKYSYDFKIYERTKCEGFSCLSRVVG